MADQTTRLAPCAWPDIDAGLQRGVDEGAVAGIVAMAARAEGMLYEGAFGMGIPDVGAAISPDSVFWLLSLTKVITATACMQLVEQGRISLDQPAGDILPALKALKILSGFDSDGKPVLRAASKPMSVRHLLTHTSGHGYSIWNDDLTRYEELTGTPHIAYSLNGAFEAPLVSEPGERWHYGIGIDWVGKLVEAVTNQSLEVYFREHIFEPLGMRDSGFLISSAQRQRVVTLHVRQEDGSLSSAPFEINQRPEFFMGGGGLFSTPRDYMRFLRMFLNKGACGSERILRADTVASMFRNQIGDLSVVGMDSAQPQWSNSFNMFPGMEQKWGLSFAINTAPGPHGRSAGSASWAGLFNSYFWLDPVKGIAGIVFTQLLPFFDARAVDLAGQFEQGIYRALAQPGLTQLKEKT